MGGDDDTVSNDAIGISLQMVSTFLAALAYVLQKMAHVEIEGAGGLAVQPWSHPASARPKMRWRVGFVIMVVCAVLDLVSYPLLDLSKQAPMGAVTLMWNTVLASWLLHEVFTVLDAICTLLIVVGTITSLLASEATSAEFTFPQIVASLNDDLVIAYSCPVVPAVLAAIVWVERMARATPVRWTPWQRRAMAIAAPGIGGMCMGFTGYGAKALSTVVGGGDWAQFKNPVAYVYLALAGVAVTGQLRYLNKGLEFFDALQVVPIFQVFIIFSNALAGIVYYHDMRHAPAANLLLFALGGILCSLGIGLMLLKSRRPHDTAVKLAPSLPGGETSTSDLIPHGVPSMSHQVATQEEDAPASPVAALDAAPVKLASWRGGPPPLPAATAAVGDGEAAPLAAATAAAPAPLPLPGDGVVRATSSSSTSSTTPGGSRKRGPSVGAKAPVVAIGSSEEGDGGHDVEMEAAGGGAAGGEGTVLHSGSGRRPASGGGTGSPPIPRRASSRSRAPPPSFMTQSRWPWCLPACPRLLPSPPLPPPPSHAAAPCRPAAPSVLHSPSHLALSRPAARWPRRAAVRVAAWSTAARHRAAAA